MNQISALEQLFLEYVNRARLDPGREAHRLLIHSDIVDPGLVDGLEGLVGAGLERGLAPGSISGLPLQVLAPNTLLRDAAQGHSEWMLDTNIFNHTGADGSSIEQRINASGYVLTNEAGFAITPPTAWGENLSWTGSTGPVDMELAVLTHAAGLFNSNGHRSNILFEDFRETGVAQIAGEFTDEGTDWNASMLTQKFALSGPGVFLTGVIYTDADGDGFYSIGEGAGGITIATSAVSTVSATHGGYALGMAPATDIEVTLTWGAVSIGAMVDLSGGNVKLDLVAGSDDSLRLLSSADLTLGAAAREAQLLGVADLSLVANDDGNLLIGNDGDNLLTGGAGDDTLQGGGGNDTLDGGGGMNTAVFTGNLADYDIETDFHTGVTVVSDNRVVSGPLDAHDGTNTILNIQNIQFADGVHQIMVPDGNGGGSDMPTVFTTTGFAFSLDEDEDFFTTFEPGAVFGVSFADAVPVLNYTYLSGNSDVDFGGSEPLVGTINGALLPENIDPSVFRFTSATGEVTDLMAFMLSPTEEYMFRIGGAELPNLSNATEANAFFFGDGTDFGRPTGATGPGVDIPFASMPGWEAVDTSAAQSITLSGFSVADESGPPNSATAQPSEFQLIFAGPGATLTQEFLGFDGPSALVNLRFDQLPISLLLNGEPIPFVEEGEFELASVRFVSGGQVTDALILDDFANDRIHFIQLGGAPLPEGTPAAVAAFLGAEDIAFFPIPEGQPTSIGTPIPLVDIAGAVVTDLPPGDGDPIAPELAAFAEASTLAELEIALVAFADTQPGLEIPAERLSQLAGDLMLYRDTEITLNWSGTVVAVDGDAEGDFATSDSVSGTYRFNLPLARYGQDQLAEAIDPTAIFQYEQFGLAGSGFSVGIPDLRLNSPSLRMQTIEFNASGGDEDALLSGLFGSDASLLVDGETYTELMIWLSAAVGIQDEITGDFEITGTEVTLNLILPGVVGLEAFIDQLDQIPLTYADVTYTFNNDEVGRAFIRADTVEASSVVSAPDDAGLLVDVINAFIEAHDAFDAVVAEANDHALTVGALNDLRESANTLFELLGGADDIDDSFFGAPYLAGEQLPEGVAARLQLFHDLDPNQKVSFLAAFNAQERTYDSFADILRAPEFMSLVGGVPDLPGPSGDPGLVRFDGWAIFEDDDDNLEAFNPVEVTLALPFVDALYSYVAMPDAEGDGPDPVDILGPQPYALLIDGVQTLGELTIGIERITVDGVSYDLFLLQTDIADATFVVQIGGSTPLPFTSFEAVAAFIDAADEDGAFGPIPDGPFAPGAAFRFGDSPYAAVDTGPAFILGGSQYDDAPSYGVGDGAGERGSASVLNGQIITLSAGDEGEGPFFNVGRGTDAIGTVIVAGPGSLLEMEAGGSAIDGADFNLGRDGGTGVLRVADGGRFEMRDNDGPDNSDSTNGGEAMHIGRGAGSFGELDVYWGGSFALKGTGSSLSVGRDEGTGQVWLSSGSSFRMETTSAGIEDFTHLRVGSEGGNGTFSVDHSVAIVQAGANGGGTIDIGGNGGNGNLLVFGTRPPETLAEHGLMITGGGDSDFVGIDIGRNASGSAAVFGGFLGAVNNGAVFDDDLNRSFVGLGGTAAMRIGSDDGAGELDVRDNAEVFVVGRYGASVEVGAGADSYGRADFDNSELNLVSDEGFAFVSVGTWGGAYGDMVLRGGSTAFLRGDTDVYFDVGWGAGNSGDLLVTDGSRITIISDSHYAGFEVGSQGGDGLAIISDGALVEAYGPITFLGIADDQGSGDFSAGDLRVTGAGTRMIGFAETIVGRTDGTGDATGFLRVENGAAVQLGAPNAAFTNLSVGDGFGATGHLTIDHALMSLYAPDGGAQPYTAFGLNGGQAFVNIFGDKATDPDAGHGYIQLGGGESAFATLDIGRGAGSNGYVFVEGAFFGTQNNGTSYDIDPPYGSTNLDGDGGRAVMRLGAQGGAGILDAGFASEIFVEGGAEGAALIVGEAGGFGAFNLFGAELTVEGAESIAFVGIGRGGFGEMTMAHGSQGRVELLSGETGFRDASIAVGYDVDGQMGNGTLTLDGAMTELAIVSARYANLSVGGTENSAGDGQLRIENGATLSYDSAAHQQLNIGRNGGAGSFEVLDGGTFTSRTTGEGFDTFMLVGTEGGSGEVRVDNASLSLVSEDGGAGIRVGTRFTHTDDNTGTGSLVFENGADVVIDGAVNTNFWIGGEENGNGSAIIRSGATLAMAGANGFAVIGGVFGGTDAPGGTGSLEVTGTGSALTGTNTLVVGFNNGIGTMSVSDGASVEVEGSDPSSFLGIGVHNGATGNGGTGSATIDGMGSSLAVRGQEAEAIVGGQNSSGIMVITNGAEVAIEASSGNAVLEIGKDGGHGTVSLNGGSLAVAGGTGSEIRVASEGTGSTGLLHVSTGANVVTGVIQVGGIAAASGVLALDGGLVTGAVSVFENGWFGGAGTVTGDVTVSAGSFRVGDLYDASEGAAADVGTLTVTGDVTLGDDASARFEVGQDGSDFLSVGGALSVNGSVIDVSYLDVFDPAVGPIEFLLAQAVEGISLDEVTLTSLFDGINGFEAELELREGDTELWFTAAPTTITVTGTVSIREANPGAVNPSGTQVTFTTDEHGTFSTVTDENGVFSFEVPVNAGGTLSLVRDFQPGTVDKALVINDVIALFNLIGDPGFADSYSAEDLRAADYDQNGQANLQDVIALFNFIGGAPDARAPEYVFVDDATDPGMLNLSSIPLPADFVIAPLIADTSLSFTAILGGDLNGYV